MSEPSSSSSSSSSSVEPFSGAHIGRRNARRSAMSSRTRAGARSCAANPRSLRDIGSRPKGRAAGVCPSYLWLPRNGRLIRSGCRRRHGRLIRSGGGRPAALAELCRCREQGDHSHQPSRCKEDQHVGLVGEAARRDNGPGEPRPCFTPTCT
jgi:hypothetical protein